MKPDDATSRFHTMGVVPEPAEPLNERYWYVEGAEARPIGLPVDEFWSQVMSGAPTDPFVSHVVQADGWLVTQYDVEGGAGHEEMHPEGDELHYLVSGDLDVVLVSDDGTEHVITMRPGSMANVPRGVWHRIEARAPSRGIAFTAGRGTRHRPTGSGADPEPPSAP
jgi:mannose-6-phosphate isomerase-like protein (cupin superfamily)